MKAEKYNIAWILLLVYLLGRGSEKDRRKMTAQFGSASFYSSSLGVFAMQN